MAKKILNLKCMNSNSNVQGSSATFALDVKPEAGAAPGAAARLTARTAVQLNFSDPKEAKDFEPGKDYKITIE